MYPVIAATHAPAGLGLSSNEIASSLAFVSPVIFFVQIIGYPMISRRISILNMWRLAAVLTSTVYCLAPPIIRIGSDQVRWTMLMALLGLRFVTVVIGWTSIAVLVRSSFLLLKTL